MSQAHLIKECTVCGGELRSIFFIGNLPPVNHMVRIGEVRPQETVYPLELMQCTSCTLAQLSCEVPKEILFPDSYPFRSSATAAHKKNFAGLANAIQKMKPEGGSVLDIGGNDGTLLSMFNQVKWNCLLVEPTDAGAEAPSDINWAKMYFSNKCSPYGKQDVITACNVFAHIHNPRSVVATIRKMLKPDGIFVSDNHYLGSILYGQWDTIYHEHLRYYSLSSIKFLLEAEGLEIFNVQHIPAHGGSIRVWAGHQAAHKVNRNNINAFLEEEKHFSTDLDYLSATARNAKEYFWEEYYKMPGAVWGVGAPSRATTLCHYYGINHQTLVGIGEVESSPKVGNYLPGTRIPIVSEKEMMKGKPDGLIMLSHHLGDALENKFRRKGVTRFLRPIE